MIRIDSSTRIYPQGLCVIQNSMELISCELNSLHIIRHSQLYMSAFTTVYVGIHNFVCRHSQLYMLARQLNGA